MASINFIYVTYNLPDRLIRNLKETLRFFAGNDIRIIDNSDDVNAKSKIRSFSSNHSISYIESSINNRYEAYNTAAQSLDNAYTVFRTDDDSFDEKILHETIEMIHEPFAISPYTYDGILDIGTSYERPIESVIFSTSFLRKLLPFSTLPASDWLLLQKAYSLAAPQHLDRPILHKVPHGRPA